MSYQPFGHKNPHHPVTSIRVCALPECGATFTCPRRSRRKFCTDLCTAKSIIQREHGRYQTVEQALAHMHRQRVYREQRRSYHTEVVMQRPVVPIELPPPLKTPVRNTHVPGSVAFMLLYGDRRQSFSGGDGTFARGGGRSARAIQRGGVSL